MNVSKKIIISIVFLLIGVFSGAQTLKVMTYNIRLDVVSDGENDWNHRKDYFTSQIHFYESDIFGVQEAKPNQVTDIATSLLQYDNVSIGRDVIGKGESSNIFMKKKDL
jgi:endonuclease/exonuclease/phosphatase family metal-dependent hydrolase